MSSNNRLYTLELKMPDNVKAKKGDEMIYKVLITPVEPSIDDRPNFSGLLADYEIEANSKTEAEEMAFIRFCQESPFRSHNREDYTISVN
ncbi:hypothetical protein [Nitrosospira multiformis]|jgi:hypothetical protein|nr:hypothetical protein [Nitrosospira multiformis]SEA71436.1 hypothetical protein SAMN05216411_12135 [Nitrosospira multiformis]